MKTIEEILDKVSKEKGYKSFINAVENLSDDLCYGSILRLVEKAMNRYAQQCCDEQIKACAEKYDNSNDELDYYQVIISTPNVAEKP